MDLEGILAVSGKSGLYKLVAQSRSGVIVESLADGKRFPVNQSGNVSALKDIAIYTEGEEKPLPEVFAKIAEKEEGGTCLDPKVTPTSAWRDYMREILPEYDEERVYNSDLKKLFSWYNILHAHDYITWPPEAENQEQEAASAEGEIAPSDSDEEE